MFKTAAKYRSFKGSEQANERVRGDSSCILFCKRAYRFALRLQSFLRACFEVILQSIFRLESGLICKHFPVLILGLGGGRGSGEGTPPPPS